MYGTMFQAASEWQRAMFSGFRMMMSASTVIQVRMMQMSLGIMKPEETARMFLEKPATFAKSTEMSMRALAGNKGLAAAALALLQRRWFRNDGAGGDRAHRSEDRRQCPAAERQGRLHDETSPPVVSGPG